MLTTSIPFIHPGYPIDNPSPNDPIHIQSLEANPVVDIMSHRSHSPYGGFRQVMTGYPQSSSTLGIFHEMNHPILDHI